MSTASSPPVISTISYQDLLREIDTWPGAGKTPCVFFGTGITTGLTDRDSCAGWQGLIQAAVVHWEAYISTPPNNKMKFAATAPTWVLAQSTDGDCMVAAGYLLRHRMHDVPTRRELASGLAGTVPRTLNDSKAVGFRTFVAEAVEDMVANTLKRIQLAKVPDPGNSLKPATAAQVRLARAIEHLGQRVEEGTAIILTTNYDDLVARIAGLDVLLPDGSVFDPDDPTLDGPLSADQTGEPRYGVPLPHRTFEYWAAPRCRVTGHRALDTAKLAPGGLMSACLHFHGWFRQPDKDFVIDPESYYQITRKDDQFTVDLNTQVQTVLRDGNRPVVFYGVGEGLLDDHIIELLEWDSDEQPDTRYLNNYWLIDPKNVDYFSQRLAEKLPESRPVTLVTGSHEEQAEVLEKIAGVPGVRPSP